MLQLLGGIVPSRLWVAAGVVLAAALIALAGYGYGYGSGKADATEKAAKAMAKHLEEDRARERETARLLTEANERNTELEKQHDKHVSDLRAEFAREQATAIERDAATIAGLRSGNERLRLQVADCNTAEAGTTSGSSPGADGTRTAELAPEAAAALWAIARDGDRAIRKLTALQDWARSAVEACGVQREVPE